MNFQSFLKNILHCFRKREKSEFDDFADHQYDNAEREMNILNILNTIQKLKAGLIALYDDAKLDKINLAKYIFLSQRMIPFKKSKTFTH